MFKSRRWAALGAALVTTAAVPLATSPADGQSTDGPYRVTLHNVTEGQPFSPPVAATHRSGPHMFEVGERASDELALIAQDGDQAPMAALFAAKEKVIDVADVGRPVTALGVTVGTFTDTVTFEIDGRPGARLSLATMLICTNDGFLGLDAVQLPRLHPVTYVLDGYDAGRERNTERSVDLVDPCSELNPGHELSGDPDGNRDAEVATSPPKRIRHHPNIDGDAELRGALHRWRDPVAIVTVEPLG
jgi:hypothetical protein